MFWQREFPSKPYSICIEYRELDESLQLKTSHIERHWRHEQREFNPFSYSNLLKDTQDLLILYIQVQMQNKTMAIYKEKPFKMPISDHIFRNLPSESSNSRITLNFKSWTVGCRSDIFELSCNQRRNRDNTLQLISSIHLHFIVNFTISNFKLQKDKSLKNLLSEYFHDERNQKGNFSGYSDLVTDVGGYLGDKIEILMSDLKMLVTDFSIGHQHSEKVTNTMIRTSTS